MKKIITFYIIFLFLFISSLTYSQSNLVAYYSFDEAAGQIVADGSGNGLDGYLGSSASAGSDDPQWVTGFQGSALYFDGVNDFVNIADNNLLDIAGQPFTLSAWIKPEGSGERQIMSKGTWGQDGNYQYRVDGSNFVSWWHPQLPPYTNQGQSGKTAVNDGQWHHAVMVYDISTIKIYIDGVLDNSTNVSGSTGANSSPLQIGAKLNTEFFKGYIDEVSIHSSALLPSEINPGVTTPSAPTFTQINLISDNQILNDGLLISSANYGAGAQFAQVNGVCFEPNTFGLSNFFNGGGDFYVNPVSPGLDAILSGLVFQPNGSQASLTISGLIPGNHHRLQLLFSNDVNVTGNNVNITVEGETYNLSSWIPSSINLVVEFTPSASSTIVTFGSNSGAEPNRAVLNAYAIHDLDQSSVSVPCGANNEPVASAGDDQVFDCVVGSADVTLDGSGSSDADNDELTYSWTLNGNEVSTSASFNTSLGEGTHIFTLTVSDGKTTSADEVSVVVSLDEEAPVPDAETLADVVGECSAVIAGTPTATDACGGSIIGATEDPLSYNSQGTYTVTWSFTDAAGNASQQTQTVIVKDNTAPAITSNIKVITLWSPNHKYETISLGDFDISVSDNCADVSSSDVIITKVTSDEAEDSKGNGDGNTKDDIVIASDYKSVELRKEREGGSNGRVYTIYASLSDGNGNITSAEFEVHVPHSKKDKAVKDDDAYVVTGGVPAANNGSGANISSEESISVKSSSLNNMSEVELLPENFELKQNYPNPFNPSTNISFSVPESGFYSLKIYNTLGQEIAELVSGQLSAGYYNYNFDASKLPSGIYIYTFIGNNVNVSKKMIFMK